ncbi:MAG TPA: hypothetical protein VLB83_00725 [Candidatus Paceibacterota bacterium]|nr:hypothetical protein [Candidatus Paceibacterota bacterium]
MEDVLKMDIFFVITTVAVIIVTALASVMLYYAIKILKNVEHVSERVSEESDNLAADIADLRDHARKEGLRFKHIADLFSGIVRRNTTGGRTKKTK